MIILGNVYKLNPNEYDVVFAIVRSPGNLRAKEKVCLMSELSPSWELFKQYMKLRDSGAWNKQSFDSIYCEKFLTEVAEQIAIDKLKYIRDLDSQGKKIGLICFCRDETLCHRSIIGGILEGMGCNVVSECGASYISYYDRYKSVCNEKGIQIE